MNIIEKVKAALEEYPHIDTLHIDYQQNDADSFGLYSTGDRLAGTDILGGQKRQHTFILYAAFHSFDDYDRLANSGLLLELQYWLEQYADGQEIVNTILGKTYRGTLDAIRCANGMLFNIPDNNMNTAVQYQMQLTADYTIESIESEE